MPNILSHGLASWPSNARGHITATGCGGAQLLDMITWYYMLEGRWRMMTHRKWPDSSQQLAVPSQKQMFHVISGAIWQECFGPIHFFANVNAHWTLSSTIPLAKNIVCTACNTYVQIMLPWHNGRSRSLCLEILIFKPMVELNQWWNLGCAPSVNELPELGQNHPPLHQIIHRPPQLQHGTWVASRQLGFLGAQAWKTTGWIEWSWPHADCQEAWGQPADLLMNQQGLIKIFSILDTSDGDILSPWPCGISAAAREPWFTSPKPSKTQTDPPKK